MELSVISRNKVSVLSSALSPMESDNRNREIKVLVVVVSFIFSNGFYGTYDMDEILQIEFK